MSHRRKARQFDKETTITIPPTMWFIMFFGGIGIGFLFGTAILIMVFMLVSVLFSELANIMGSILTIIIGLIILYVLRRYFVGFGALLFGLIVGVLLAILWSQMGWYSPVPPGETDIPNMPEFNFKEFILWRVNAG
jgi:hypothetical protein